MIRLAGNQASKEIGTDRMKWIGLGSWLLSIIAENKSSCNSDVKNHADASLIVPEGKER